MSASIKTAAALLFLAAAASLWAMPIVGNGAPASESRNLTGFTKIVLGGTGNVAVHRGDYKFTISADSNLLAHISTVVRGKTLEINIEPRANLLFKAAINYDITLPVLEAITLKGSSDTTLDPFSGSSLDIDVSGSGSLTGQYKGQAMSINISGSGTILATFEGTDLKTVISGSGDLDLTAKVQNFNSDINGSGTMKIAGSTKKASLGISGIGTISGSNFDIEDATVRITGSGDCIANISKTLTATISGVGSIKYKGDPRVTQSITGSGSITNLGPR